MTSGIYELTFPNGETYVGKSVNITNRWKQHADKLSKGTAAANMQAAVYSNRFNNIAGRVLLEVHPDLLDMYENYYINTLKPKLNTVIPNPRSDYSTLVWWAGTGRAVMPVSYMMEKIRDLEVASTCYKHIAEEAEEELREVQERWDNKVELEAYKDEVVQEIIGELLLLRQFRVRVEGLGWWGRLWKLW